MVVSCLWLYEIQILSCFHTIHNILFHKVPLYNKQAAVQKAEGEKVLKVKNAEAQAEGMYLSGVGVARQRKVWIYTSCYYPLDATTITFKHPHIPPLEILRI